MPQLLPRQASHWSTQAPLQAVSVPQELKQACSEFEQAAVQVEASTWGTVSAAVSRTRAAAKPSLLRIFRHSSRVVDRTIRMENSCILAIE